MSDAAVGKAPRVVIVTGAAGGIGRAIANVFLNEKAMVAAIDKDAAGLRSLQRQHPGAVLPFAIDATDARTALDTVSQIVNQWGRVDVLVNNVGGRIGSPALGVPRDEWDATIALCLTSHLFWMQAVEPIMVRQKSGRIVNIASNAGVYRSNTGSSGISYSAAKGGVAQLTRSAAHDLGRHGITVNAIAPGSVLTEAGLLERDTLDPDLYDRVMRETALGYFAPPDEIASVALFLASEEASYVTGVTIKANGGWCTN